MRHYQIYWRVGDKSRRWEHSMMAALGQNVRDELRRRLLEDMVEHDVLEYSFKELGRGNADPIR